jgi:hypothetical protein
MTTCGRSGGGPWSARGAAAPPPRRHVCGGRGVVSRGVLSRDLVVVRVVGLEVRRGGVEEDDVDLEVQQRRDAEEHRLLHPLPRTEQEVHRPVQLIIRHALETVDRDVFCHPPGRLALGRGRQAALADHRQDGPLDIRAVARRAGGAGQRLADPQLRPQGGEHVRPTRLRGAQELEPARRRGRQRLLAAEVALDRGDQPPQRGAVEQVLTAEVVDHARDRHPAFVALVVGELQIAHDLAALRPPRRRPQTRAYTLGTPPPRQALTEITCAYRSSGPAEQERR